MNKGFINSKNEYIKHVSFINDAVLWKNGGELSLPPEVILKIQQRRVKVLRFIAQDKKEIWSFSADYVIDNMVLRREGQEEQYYFPIAQKVVSPLVDPAFFTNPDDVVVIPVDTRLKLREAWLKINNSRAKSAPVAN